MKIKKGILFFCLSYYCIAKTFAQSNNYWGINFMPQAQSDIYFNNYQPTFGYSTGINYFNKKNSESKIFFESDLLFSYQKGAMLYVKPRNGDPNVFDPIEPYVYEKRYFIKTPILFHYNISENYNYFPSAFAGFQPNVALKNISLLAERNIEKYSTFDFSAIVGIGINKNLVKNYRIISQVRIEYTPHVIRYNLSNDFSIGILVGFVLN